MQGLARSLWLVFRETLRLYKADPIGMLTVSTVRIVEGRTAAQLQLARVEHRIRRRRWTVERLGIGDWPAERKR